MSFIYLKKKLLMSIAVVLALISLVTGFTTLLVSSQKQLNRLEKFPNQLDLTIANSLQGKKSPYYQVFLMSLDAGFIMDKDGKTNNEFSNLLVTIMSYNTNGFIPKWTSEELNAIDNGNFVWSRLLDDLISKHLTYNATNGFGYFWQNLTHGKSIIKLLQTPIQETKVIDTVLKELLTEMKNPLAYLQVNAVNRLAKASNLPHPPNSITLSMPEITGMKVGTVFLVIVFPFLTLLLVVVSFSYYIYGKKELFTRQWNKVIGNFNQTKLQDLNQPIEEEVN